MALGTTNISTTLVGTTLGTSSRDVGTLCTHPSINKWSKWKPIRQNTVSGITAMILSNANFGLVPASTSTNYAAIAGVKWTYNKPRGGDYNEPYRLGDFRNYNHAALPICTIDEAPKANRTFNTSKQISAAINVSGTDDTIGLDDFTDTIGDMYFGAVIVDGSSVYIQTATATLSNGGNSFDLDLTASPLNTDKTVDFNYLLSSVQVANLSLLSSVFQPTFAPLPTSDTADNEVSLVITSGFGISTITDGINSILSSLPNSYIPQSYYNTIGNDPFTTIGGLFLKITLYNDSDSPVSIPSGTWKIQPYLTFWNNGVPSNNTNNIPINVSAYELGGGLVTYPITLAVGASKTFVVGSDHVMDRDGYGYTVINPATMDRMALNMSDVDVIYNNTVITSIQVPMQTEAP